MAGGFRLGLNVSPGFLLLLAALYFWGGGAAATAFLSAALAHELGHLAAILCTGARVRELRLLPSGPVIEYAGALSRRQEMGVVAAGPAGGLIFAVCCLTTESPYFNYAGAIALLSTAFNLLPALPMDGGRLALGLLETAMDTKTAERVMRLLGSMCGLGISVTGLLARSPAAAAAGIWVGVLANRPDLR